MQAIRWWLASRFINEYGTVIVREGVKCYIGNGVVLDIHHLLSEIAELEKGQY